MKKVLEAWLNSVHDDDPQIERVLKFIYGVAPENKPVEKEKRAAKSNNGLQIPRGFTNHVYKAMDQCGGKATVGKLVDTLQNMPGFSFGIDEDTMGRYLRKNGKLFKYWKIDDSWSRINWGMPTAVASQG